MKQQTMPWLVKTSHAILSEDRVYRYALYRSLDGQAWDANRADPSITTGTGATVCFIMLNPSKADEDASDPTIDKLMKYSRSWGFDRLVVVNLFAYRETDSKKLRSLAARTDLIGPENDHYIFAEAAEAHKVVLGWGNEGDLLGRGEYVAKMLNERHCGPLWCFKKTNTNQPTHPLYQRDAAELVEFR